MLDFYEGDEVKSEFWKEGNVVKISTKDFEYIDTNGIPGKYENEYFTGTLQSVILFKEGDKFYSLDIDIMDDHYNIESFSSLNLDYFENPEKYNCELIEKTCRPGIDRFYGPEDYKLWKVGNKIKIKVCTNVDYLESLMLKYEDSDKCPKKEYEFFIGTIQSISVAKDWKNCVEDVSISLLMEDGTEHSIMVEQEDYLWPEEHDITLIEERKDN